MKIITTPLKITLHGFGGIAPNRDYVGTAFKLMGNMWQIVKANNIKNKGMNVFVYEDDHKVFAGVELIDVPENTFGLERKDIMLNKYAYEKHIGSYGLIGKTGQSMRDEIQRMGLIHTLPDIEIYGHWTEDESKLETELFMTVQ